jgi:archaemetzincin
MNSETPLAADSDVVSPSPSAGGGRVPSGSSSRLIWWTTVVCICWFVSHSPGGRYAVGWVASVASAAARPAYRHSEESLRPFVSVKEQLEPLATKKRPVQPGDWLSEHPEPGQSFVQFVRSQKLPVREGYSRIYVVPMGTFTPAQERLLAETREFVSVYFGMETVCIDDQRGIELPAHAKRLRANGKHEQWLAPYLMTSVLQPAVPSDAACVIGLTGTDLWSGPGSNFLFGVANPEHRVGVWSLARNGDPDAGEIEYRRCLRRTLKTAVHEIGHMFGIDHCTAYECCMNGANHAEESDSQPVEYCPECLPKLCWTCRIDPIERVNALIAFTEAAGLHPEAAAWRKARHQLTSTR